MNLSARSTRLVLGLLVGVGAIATLAQAPPAPPAAPAAPAAPALPVAPPPAVAAPARVAPRLVSTPAPTTPANALVADAELKELTAEPGQASAHFTFWLTNTATVPVSIHNVHTSCGCTVARLPAQPWNLVPGGSGPIDVSLDLRAKRGILTKSITIQSSSGVKNLMIRATVPDASGFVAATTGGMLDADRVKNIQKSLVDRQVVFKDRSCAECHADKAAGKLGKELFDVACGICHDAPHRATMVTDLKQRNPGLPEGWRQWIVYGKTNSLMPAFARSTGGILSDAQVDSLVAYVGSAVPPGPEFSAAASVPPGVPPAFRVAPPPPPVALRPSLPLVRANVQRPAGFAPVAIPSEPPAPPVPEPPATPIDSVPFPKDN